MKLNLTGVLVRWKENVIFADIALKDFLLLLDILEKSFGVKPKLSSLPEAEVATFDILGAKIYA